jgi:hypothetical protein
MILYILRLIFGKVVNYLRSLGVRTILRVDVYDSAVCTVFFGLSEVFQISIFLHCICMHLGRERRHCYMLFGVIGRVKERFRSSFHLLYATLPCILREVDSITWTCDLVAQSTPVVAKILEIITVWHHLQMSNCFINGLHWPKSQIEIEYL